MKLCIVPVLAVCAIGSLSAQETTNSAENPFSTRWARLNALSVGFRSVVEQNSAGANTVAQGQHQEFVSGEFRFDKDAKYTLQTSFSSGNVFTGGWSDSDIGRAKGTYGLYWKKFYLSAKPVAGVEFQYGGIGIEQGTISEIIGYSNDGYVTGGRVSVRQPRILFFDTVSATFGYLGDLNTPEMNKRFRRLDQVNFRQYLVTKRIGSRAEVSLQYSNRWGIKTFNQSIKLAAKESRFVDAVLVEFYERVRGDAHSGFNLGAEKGISTRLKVGGGYAALDRNIGDLNTNAFFHGNRVYLMADFRVAPAVTFFALVNHGVNNAYALPNRTHVHFGFSYDIVKAFSAKS